MKATKIISVLSLVLIFAAVSTVYSAGIEPKNNQVLPGTVTRYQVNVVFSSEKPLCNMYLVKIIDGNGRLVAPAQPYILGVSRYEFTERGLATGKRIAVLVKNQYGDPIACPTELFTKPAVLNAPFVIGQTYRFDLFPSTLAPKH